MTRLASVDRCSFVGHDGKWPTHCGRLAVGHHVSRSDATSSMVDAGLFCKFHLGVLKRRDDKALAPHVHKAWVSTVRVLPDGTVIRNCADCGAIF
jgi:hypothetical protein